MAYLGKISVGGNYAVSGSVVTLRADTASGLGNGQSWTVEDANLAASLRSASAGSAGRRVYIHSGEASSNPNTIRNVSSWGLDQVGIPKPTEIQPGNAEVYVYDGPLITDSVPSSADNNVSGGAGPCDTCEQEPITVTTDQGGGNVPSGAGGLFDTSFGSDSQPDATGTTAANANAQPESAASMGVYDQVVAFLQSNAFGGIPWWVIVVLLLLLVARRRRRGKK